MARATSRADRRRTLVDAGLVLRAATLSLREFGNASLFVAHHAPYLLTYLLAPMRQPERLSVVRDDARKPGAFDPAEFAAEVARNFHRHRDGEGAAERTRVTCDTLSAALLAIDW